MRACVPALVIRAFTAQAPTWMAGWVEQRDTACIASSATALVSTAAQQSGLSSQPRGQKGSSQVPAAGCDR